MISEDEPGTPCLRSIEASAEENATDEKMRAKVRRIVRLMVAGRDEHLVGVFIRKS